MVDRRRGISLSARDAGRIGVLIVDGHRLVAGGLNTLLEAEPDIEVLGQAGTVADAGREIRRLSPDTVLVAFRLPDGTAVDVGNAVRDTRPATKVILLTDDDGDGAKFAAVAAGAVAIIQKSRAGDDLIDAIRSTAAGNVLITPQTVASILARQHQVDAQSEQITGREREVLRLVAEGMSSREIAAQLGVGYATVRAHIYHLSKKLGARSKLELVAKAHSGGLI